MPQYILKTVEIRFDDNGKFMICSHQGWTLNEQETPVQIRIFSDAKHRIKVAVYGTPIDYLETFGVWLCRALIERNPDVWKTVNLSDCDR